MREIKFRAWDVEEKCWIPQAQLAVAALDGQKDILTYDEDEDRWIAETISFDLQQFTGLHDKNGKEIYEGDVIQYTYLPGKTFWNYDGKGIIEWESTGFKLSPLPNKGGISAWLTSLPGMYEPACHDLIEIIGNIYENPDLLT